MSNHELLRNSIPDPIPWSSGAGEFLAFHKYNLAFQPPIMVQCEIGSLKTNELAMLDTGAQWSIMGGETADLVQSDLGPAIKDIKMDTRLEKSMKCTIHQLNITLKAQWGKDLVVNSRVAVCNNWRGPLVLGFLGFLENLRIGFEPQTSRDQPNLFYFGGE